MDEIKKTAKELERLVNLSDDNLTFATETAEMFRKLIRLINDFPDSSIKNFTTKLW